MTHGSTQVLEHVADRRAVPAQDRVDQQDVRLGLDVEDGDRASRSPDVGQAEQLADEQHEQDADAEDRGGVGEDAEEPDAGVGRGVAVAPGEPAEREADHQREDERRRP